MDVTPEMIVAQNRRLEDGITDVASKVDALQSENRKLRDALFQFSYPIDPQTLREVADEIDCGSDCEHGSVEWDTNAHNCSRENKAEGCAFAKAYKLRLLAEAIETRDALTKSD